MTARATPYRPIPKRSISEGIRALVLVAVGAFASTSCAREAATTPPAGHTNVPLQTVRFGTIVETVCLQGRVGAPSENSTNLAFAEPGILKTIDVHIGDAVTAGETLAELDRAPLAAPLAQAQADARAASAASAGGAVAAAAGRSASARLAVALSKLHTLERGGLAASGGRIEAAAIARAADLKLQADRANVARARQLFDSGVIARKDLEAAQLQAATDAADLRNATAKIAVASSDALAALAQARADVAAARSDVAAAAPQRAILASQADSAQAKLDAARVAYDNGSLEAPAAGVVLAILKRAGEAVDTTTPVIELGPRVTASTSITLTAPAAIAQRIEPGAAASIRLASASAGTTPAENGTPVNGRITAVLPAVDSATQAVTISAIGTPANAIAGAAVTATIAVGTSRGIVVPQSAIVEDPESGNSVVFVRREPAREGESAFEMRAIASGASDASHTIVTAGLRAGETIAVEGGYALLAPVGGG